MAGAQGRGQNESNLTQTPSTMTATTPAVPLLTDELPVLAACAALDGRHLIELGCGNARLLRRILQAHRNSRGVGLEVDAIQHARNLADPQPGLTFVAAGAQAIPFADGTFDLALMLKSLHHVPVEAMDQALKEVARVLRPGGLLYVSEPVYDGALNDIVRLYNDEGPVRAAAQAALDHAITGPLWTQVDERRFDMPVHFTDFDEFERRMMYPTFVDHHIDEALRLRVQAAFQPHQTDQGVDFTRPMHVRVLRRHAG